MSVLDRYKKTGGFVQLLALLETCGTAKREKFLSMILEENADWHDALKPRILSIEKILSWPNEYLIEVTSRSLPITLAAVSKGLTEVQIKKLFQGLSHSHFAKIREISENKAFTPIEIISSTEKLLGETRTYIQQGILKLEKFDPELATPSDVEEVLAKKSMGMPPLPPPEVFSEKAISKNNHGSPPPSPSAHNHNVNDELAALRRQNFQMQQELQTLKQENHSMKEKLERIRKIA